MKRDYRFNCHLSNINDQQISAPTNNKGAYISSYQLLKRATLMVLVFWLSTSTFIVADETPNAKQARRIFNQTYDMVFGPKGSTLQYNVNIIGVMKVSGTIWYKGKKKRYQESRYLSWNDGKNYSRVDLKKKTVTLYDSNNRNKDKYESKFTFDPRDFDYYVEDGGSDFIVNLEAHKNTKGYIKRAKAIIDKRTRAPKSLKIKLLWFWTTVKISNFKSGNISDDLFTFPSSKFKNYTWIDNRGK